MPTETTWYIKPNNKLTNDIIAGLPGISADSDFCPEQTVTENHQEKTVNLWLIPNYSIVSALEESQRTVADLRFTLFSKQGKYGKIKRTPFLSQLSRNKQQKQAPTASPKQTK